MMIQDMVFGVLLTWLGFWTAGAASMAPSPEPACAGALSQGGLIVCTAQPGATIAYDGTAQRVGDDGLAVFGITRDASSPALVSVLGPSRDDVIELEIAPRDDPFRVIEGLDCDKVDARTPEQKAHAGESWVTKQAAFSTFHAGNDWANGFLRPAEGPASSPFGPSRKYIGLSAVTGEPCDKVSIHRGYDIATPVGTTLIAPAGGTVTLADLDLYYEGGTIFLDHGHGLVSVFMHLSEIDVSVGDVVAAGDTIGATGNTGRTTGPHLHWAVKWRDTTSEDRGGDFYIDPALLLEAEYPAMAVLAHDQRASEGSTQTP